MTEMYRDDRFSPSVHSGSPVGGNHSQMNYDSGNRVTNDSLACILEQIGSLGQTVESLKSQLHSEMEEQVTDIMRHIDGLEKSIRIINSRLTTIEHPDPEVQFNFRAENSSGRTDPPRGDLPRGELLRGNNERLIDEGQERHERSNNQFNANMSANNFDARPNGCSSKLKMRPQNYDGSEDLQDFLNQFEITAEINRWSYEDKSLYLASVLTGNARSLLSELNHRERRDFSILVERLNARFGCEQRAEVFRTQLKTRVRAKNETIPELAQSVKKMTRQAYPSGSLEVIESLALDNFIDALTDADIRLRLRELSPKTLTEAEGIAVRMEAHKIADRQRSKVVGHVDHLPETGKLAELEESISRLSQQVDNLTGINETNNSDVNRPRKPNSGNYSRPNHQPSYDSGRNGPGYGSPDNRNGIYRQDYKHKYQRFDNQDRFQNFGPSERGRQGYYNFNNPQTKPNSSSQHRPYMQNAPNHNQNLKFQGNENQSSWRDRNLTVSKGPISQ